MIKNFVTNGPVDCVSNVMNPGPLAMCARNESFTLILTEEIENELEETDLIEEEQTQFDNPEPTAGIILQSLIGFNQPKTMKLEGKMVDT